MVSMPGNHSLGGQTGPGQGRSISVSCQANCPIEGSLRRRTWRGGLSNPEDSHAPALSLTSLLLPATPYLGDLAVEGHWDGFAFITYVGEDGHDVEFNPRHLRKFKALRQDSRNKVLLQLGPRENAHGPVHR